jgi:hypothetical protein
MHVKTKRTDDSTTVKVTVETTTVETTIFKQNKNEAETLIIQFLIAANHLAEMSGKGLDYYMKEGEFIKINLAVSE